MAIYPPSPVPASISVAAVVDPMLAFTSDSGYGARRALRSRPYRRWQLDYLGQNTANMRVIRDFLQQQRLGVLPFEWVHSTAGDTAVVSNTTPVLLVLQHSYMTGQWVWISQSTPNTALNGFWQITRVVSTGFTLNGSVAGGAGTCFVVAYLPNAVGVFAEDTLESPVKLIGPESVDAYATRRGMFNFSVFIEEIP
jgi:hypothetical protein